MRVQPNTELITSGAESAAAQQTQKVTHLLQEALTLLHAAPMSIAHIRNPDRLLRLPEVERLTGLCRSTIYDQMRKGIFPSSVKTGQRAAAWPESAVQAWIAERMHGRTP